MGDSVIQPISLIDLFTHEPPPPNWLVEGMFLRGLVLVLAGEPGAGKTALSHLLGHSLALGRPFLGHKTTPTTVCYFDEENSRVDFQRYSQWIWHGLGSPPIEEYGNRLNFYHFGLPKSWFDAMEEVAIALKPGLIVIDTANPVLRIDKENDNDEAGRVIGQLRRLQHAAGSDTTILVLKHEKQRDEKQHRRTIRGAKTWEAAVDRTFYHVIPRGCRARKNGLRRTALIPDKMRSYGLEVPIGIEPDWTDASRKGLIFKGILDDQRGVRESEES